MGSGPPAMTGEQWQTAWRIFNTARQFPVAEHRPFVESETDDPEVARRVFELLESSPKLDEGEPARASRDGIRRARQEESGGAVAVQSAPPGSMESHRKAPLAGQTLGSYEILAVLGAGAMGQVYRARDSRLGREVALKVLPPHLTHDPGRIARFQSEARAASALNHLNTVTIYEIGQADGIWFIAAELIEGVTLRERLEAGKLSAEEAVEIATQCAATLGAAHSAGILHRDVKPENIMIRPDGVVKVVDFGLARILEPRPEWGVEATQTGSVMGTPRYMSPEQARGQALDGRTDVFSLGAVLFEMVAGQPAFPGKTMPEIFVSLLSSTPNFADAGPLATVTRRALAKDPAARYQTMEEFAGDLRTVDPKQTRSLPKRNAWRPMMSRGRKAVAAPLLVAAAGLAVYTWISRDTVREGFKVAPLATFAGAKGYGALSPDGNRIAFSWQAPGSSTQHIYVKPVGEGEPVQLTFSRYNDAVPAWSPDGRQIAFTRWPNGDNADMPQPQDIYIVPVGGGRERKIAEAWRSVSWSPDGRTIALAHVPSNGTAPVPESGGIFLLSLESGHTRELTVSREDSYPVFSPNGRWIAFKRQVSGTKAEIFVIPAGGGVAKRLTSEPYPIRGPTWTADSREVVFGSLRSGADGSLWRVAAAGGAPRPVSPTLRDAFDPSISRQGRLAYREEWMDSNLYLLTAKDLSGTVPAGFDEPVSVVNSSREDHSPAFSPDGERIAFVSNRSGNLEIWVARRDGSQATPLTSLRAQNTGTPRWSPDGRRIAFDSWASGKSAIYVVDSAGGVPRMITGGPMGSWMPSWSPDGAWIYFSRGISSPSEIWRIQATDGEAIQVTHSGAFEAHLSPDGKLIYYSKQSPEGGRTIWSVPAAGGIEKPVPELAKFREMGRSWGVIEQGIYFVSYEDSPQQTVRLLSFRTYRVTPLFRLQKQMRWGIGSLALSREGHYAVAAQLDHAVNDLMMIDNFR
jgi:eukaryotic-like serine/threonine-protein kinase